MIVLDASALVDLVADGGPRDWVRGQLSGQVIAAPGHQLAEVASAVSRLVRAGDMTEENGAAALADAARLPQQVHPVDETMLGRAWTWRGRLRVLDGLYVALAEDLDALLVTTDRRLLRAKPPCAVSAPPDID